MPFRNNNVAFGLPVNSQYQVGESNIDTNSDAERGITIPTVSSAEPTWVYFDCNISVMLDSGIVVHNRLPQVDKGFDTLSANTGSTYGSSAYEKTLDTSGINLKCTDQYQDIIQRMGHARYWFRLYGRAIRLRYQVPIPGIKFIGGVPAIPYDKNPQWAYNSIVPGGNFGGVILWKAEWSLWYTTSVPPINQSIPASDPSGHITSTDTQPRELQAPYSQADENSVTNIPYTLAGAGASGAAAGAAAVGNAIGGRG